MHLFENTDNVANISYIDMKYEMGLTKEDRPSVGRVHSTSSHHVRDVCHFLGDILFPNTVLKVYILKLLLLPLGQSRELLFCTAWFGKQATGYYFFSR